MACLCPLSSFLTQCSPATAWLRNQIPAIDAAFHSNTLCWIKAAHTICVTQRWRLHLLHKCGQVGITALTPVIMQWTAIIYWLRVVGPELAAVIIQRCTTLYSVNRHNFIIHPSALLTPFAFGSIQAALEQQEQDSVCVKQNSTYTQNPAAAIELTLNQLESIPAVIGWEAGIHPGQGR